MAKKKMIARPGFIGLWLCLSSTLIGADLFQLPTANRALYQVGAMERYFAPTAGRSWESGTFGCVRNEGWRFHEGMDVRCLERDKEGEPTDDILATADGVVAYVNERAPLSNYGKYLVLQHQVEGLEIFSLYAHLSQIQAKLAPGRKVKAGEVIGVMGRTANTREPISPERAHLHFELNLLLNDRFPAWFKLRSPGERNDHGAWNGQNLVGLDPRLVLLHQRRGNGKFSLLEFIQRQTGLCRVWVRKSDFPWVRRYPALIQRNPLAEKEGVAGYEITLNFNGLPFQLMPRSASEAKHYGKVVLLSVNTAEQRKNPCRRLVEQKNGHWVLDQNGAELIDLLTY
jgi:murein DD-endopeptidase MepM/ murein hydrolase activator NlpD